ncbi:hypothetical protein [Paenibacillus sp. HB172176]|uniref:hypothetical protein n=1 Tax=Paenibacillus sp. HB172176 TaxID=2493690 RepID=UPI00143CB1EE|nr:hypothetical protein [Paenibacillus sp. HB172176]
MSKKSSILILILIFSLILNACGEKDKLVELNSKIDQLGDKQDAKYLKELVQNINYYDKLILQGIDSRKVELDSDVSAQAKVELALLTFGFLVLDRDIAKAKLSLLKNEINEKEFKGKMETIKTEYKKDRVKYMTMIEDYISKLNE